MTSYEVAQELIRKGIRARYAETDELGVIAYVPKTDPNVPGYSFRIWVQEGYWMLGVLEPWPYETKLKVSQRAEEIIEFALAVFATPQPKESNESDLTPNIVERFNQLPIEVYRYDSESISGYAQDKLYEFAVFRQVRTWFAVMINKNDTDPTQLIAYGSELMTVMEMVRLAVKKES